jgi:hypothetical protein
MFSPAEQNEIAPRHRRFRLAEALLIAGILVFGGFALLSDGRMTPEALLAGFDQAIGR